MRYLILAIVAAALGCDLVANPKMELVCVNLVDIGDAYPLRTDIGVSVDGRLAVSSTGHVWFWVDDKTRIGYPMSGRIGGFLDGIHPDREIPEPEFPGVPCEAMD